MSKQLHSSKRNNVHSRLFPWHCPKCRRNEVELATIRHECERLHQGKPVTVVVENLVVPRCGNCGELVFDYEAEKQINRAFEEQSDAQAASSK